MEECECLARCDLTSLLQVVSIAFGGDREIRFLYLHSSPFPSSIKPRLRYSTSDHAPLTMITRILIEQSMELPPHFASAAPSSIQYVP
jgi:hypothetical protein